MTLAEARLDYYSRRYADYADDFALFAGEHWKIANKAGEIVRFQLNPAQKLADAEYKRQMDSRGFVRMNLLKCRQPGGTTYCISRALHRVMTQPRQTALTLAHEQTLPEVWLRKCRRWRDMTKDEIRPHVGGTQRAELYFDQIASRYYVGSCGGGFPGMGDCIHFLHLSEVGSWDKSPVMVDPDKILADLKPALPTGSQVAGTVQIRESTGRIRGDWWHNVWQGAKEPLNEFTNVFLPWFIVPEYRDDNAPALGRLTPHEEQLSKHAKRNFALNLDQGQLAWRRNQIVQEPYYGDAEMWASFYPAYEEEAFLSPGLSVFSTDQVTKARETIREPIWRGDLIVGHDPKQYSFDAREGGALLVWEKPRDFYHYVIGADCRWGAKDTTDYDVAYVQCLETGTVCARMRGRFDLALWGKFLAALGFHYAGAVLAPERNSVAATALFPLLLGNVAPWRYPNVWVRSKQDTIKPRIQDYGWYTDANTKGDIIAFAKHGTLEGTFDWADELAVDEMQSWVHDEKTGNPTAPTGAFDDALMARMITAYVSHQQRFVTDLYVEPKPFVLQMRTPQQRVQEDIVGVGDTDE